MFVTKRITYSSMRNIVNISLPEHLAKEMRRGMKRFRFSSKSEFFRHLLREWLAGRLALELEESRREYKAGNAKKLTRTADLWK